jgi:signal-transduction protein with cAMP-binding, CBS, and nucleotidyltransferase domain
MNLEKDLQYEQVVHLDVSDYTQVKLGTSVKDTVGQMRRENNNCAIVIQHGNLVGIFTERDLLTRVIGSTEAWEGPIDDVMTTSPTSVMTNDPAYSALEIMDKNHCRNVPVVDQDGTVIGNLTHYAIIKYLADRFPSTIYNLPPESDRITDHRDGA